MATVGNLAATQLLMARALTNYGYTQSSSNSTSSASASSTSAQEQLDKLMTTTLKNKSDYFKEQYSKIYKSIYGLTDDNKSQANSTLALKTSSSNTMNAANDLTSYANGLKYGDEYDADEYADLAQKFVDSYNSMVENVGNSNSSSVLQKGVILVNTAKIFSASLNRAGITLGSDNKLTFDKDRLSDEVSTLDIKTTFGGDYGFSNKVSQKAQQIGSLSGGLGALSYTSSSLPSYAYNIGALFSIYA